MAATADPKAAEERFADWLSHGWAIGVFENKDLGSRDVGLRYAMPFDREQMAMAVIGDTRGPDTPAYGLGWRYILVAKPSTVDEAVKAVFDRSAP
jgi:hypothetical protein